MSIIDIQLMLEDEKDLIDHIDLGVTSYGFAHNTVMIKIYYK